MHVGFKGCIIGARILQGHQRQQGQTVQKQTSTRTSKRTRTPTRDGTWDDSCQLACCE